MYTRDVLAGSRGKKSRTSYVIRDVRERKKERESARGERQSGSEQTRVFSAKLLQTPAREKERDECHVSLKRRLQSFDVFRALCTRSLRQHKQSLHFLRTDKCRPGIFAPHLALKVLDCVAAIINVRFYQSRLTLTSVQLTLHPFLVLRTTLRKRSG